MMKVNDANGVQCFICRNYGHKSYECPSRKQHSQSQSSLKKRWCCLCKSTTHDTKQCRKKKDAVKSLTEESPQSDSFAFRASECRSVCQGSLLVDCGATAHIITDKSKFTSFEQSFDTNSHCIELADGSRPSGIVQGRVCLFV